MRLMRLSDVTEGGKSGGDVTREAVQFVQPS